MPTKRTVSRRSFLRRSAAAAATAVAAPAASALADQRAFSLRYIVGSSLYGRLKLDEIVPEVPKAGAAHLDVWPRPHGDQREQIEAMGHEKFAAMLARHRVKLGILTHYDLGPFALGKELPVARKFGASMMICMGMPRKKADLGAFIERIKPHVDAAAEVGVTLGIENHGESPDAIRRFAEAAKSKHLGVALAPYHLPHDAAALARLIEDLGDKLVLFYAWQHGKGCMKKLPKDQELLQMPGRGPLDFGPLLAALRKIGYTGWTEIFMHPVPRGIPILPTAAEVTAEINRARKHLDTLAGGRAAPRSNSP